MSETDTLEAVTRAVEKELSRNFGAWLQLWGNPTGICDDAPDPPAKGYETSPKRIARAALEAVLDDMAEPSEGTYSAVAVLDMEIDTAERSDVNTLYQAFLAQYRKETLGEIAELEES